MTDTKGDCTAAQALAQASFSFGSISKHCFHHEIATHKNERLIEQKIWLGWISTTSQNLTAVELFSQALDSDTSCGMLKINLPKPGRTTPIYAIVRMMKGYDAQLCSQKEYTTQNA